MFAPTYPLRRVIRHQAMCLSVSLLCLSAFAATAAAPGPAVAEIEARYKQDRAKCLSGISNQDQSTCLQEATAARDAAKRGQLDDGDARYRRNAKVRCEALTGDEARDCLDRMKGGGTRSGSAQGGGLYRESVTRTTPPPEVAGSPAPAASSPRPAPSASTR